MDQEKVLAAIDAAPGGEIAQEELFTDAFMPPAAIALTNLLARMRRAGLVKAVKNAETGVTVYRRAEPTAPGGNE